MSVSITSKEQASQEGELSRPLTFRVIKLGGTSVASPECWARFLDYQATLPSHTHTVLVCSAVGGVTNLLERIAMPGGSESGYASLLSDLRQRHEQLLQGLACSGLIEQIEAQLAELERLARARPDRETELASWRARVLAQGELLSSRLAAAYLQRKGLDATWIDARRIVRGPCENSSSRSQQYLSAHFAAPSKPRLQEELERSSGRLSVTQGFIGSNEAGETVLLGRGGSDTSAAILAAMLDASELEIWTDVPGFYSADPRRVDRARLLPSLSYDEAAVLGSLGAKILHPRSLAPLRERDIPVSIKWSHQPHMGGTSISQAPRASEDGIRAVASRHPLTLYALRRPRRWQPVGFMSEVSTIFEQHGLSMDLVSCSSSEIRATIDLAAASSPASAFSSLERDLASVGELTKRERLSCVSLAGTRVSRDLPRLAPLLGSSSNHRIHLFSHAADDTHLSWVVDSDDADTLVRLMHGELIENATPGAASTVSRPSEALPTQSTHSL